MLKINCTKAGSPRSLQLISQTITKRHQSSVQQAPNAATSAADAQTKLNKLPNAAVPPSYTLATTRSFPSLEPLSFVPVPSSFLAAPLRRDILWKAVVFENDNKRTGNIVIGRSDNGYSRRKLHKQKGTGKARVGDANSPIRMGGGRAFGRREPNNPHTDLPYKVYQQAFNVALSHQYKEGKLMVIGNTEILGNGQGVHECDTVEMDIVPNQNLSTNLHEEGELIFENFLRKHNLKNVKHILFITDEFPESLHSLIDEKYGKKITIMSKEFVGINDILKANRVFVELPALEYLAVMNHVE
ncbi:hypothetical protein ACO0QE_000705 [Hanseniaspora vineae]